MKEYELVLLDSYLKEYSNLRRQLIVARSCNRPTIEKSVFYSLIEYYQL